MEGRVRKGIVWIGLLLLLVACVVGCRQRKERESDVADDDKQQSVVEESDVAGMVQEADKDKELSEESVEAAGNKNGAGQTGQTGQAGQRGQTGQPGQAGQVAAGPLAVSGTQLVDSQGNPVQLKGISTHGLAWYPDYVNRECFAQLKDEWGADLIRLAMYTGESGGYCTGGDKESLKALIRDGVEYATDCGLYVIIDWHILSDGNPNTYIEESKAFFREMSLEYADYTNVLYEICNEPNGGTSWREVKSYAEQIIDVIRENDEDGIILVGTPNWCQYVDQAAEDPIENCENVMYTLHFYADTHRDSLRNAMVNAINAGLPIFVSEYGICDASGNGAINREQAKQWVSVLNQYGVSYVAWNLSNKGETSALIKSSCNKVSGFAAEDLSDSGRWLYEMLNGKSEENAGTGWEGTGMGAAGGQNASSTGAGTTGSGTSGGSAGQSEANNGAAGNNTVSDSQTFTVQNGLSVSASVVNSWEQDGQKCFQYVLTISNTSDAALSSWSVQLEFNGNIALDSGWNGNYQAEGSRLIITSMDYNGNIVSGGSVGDIGFILRGDMGLELAN